MAAADFLVQSTVYLAAAVICVPIAKRIGLGSVLGYLIAGMLIGPFVFGFLGEEGEDLMHFAEFGVVIMLFIIGLELEPEKLWRLRKKILGVGMSQVLITAAVIFGVTLALGLVWQTALTVALALSLSSTAIVLQTLSEKNLMDTEGGRNSFSVLLFQDIAVIPILAILPLLAFRSVSSEEGSNTVLEGLPLGLQTVAVLGAVALIVLAGRYLIVPGLRVIARARIRELFTAAALLIVVSIALLMQSVGLSPALGTFLGGVILANSEYRHELESDLDPIKGLLLGLFFIAVGATIDFALIAENLVLVTILTASLMAVKFLILFSIGRFFNLLIGQNFLFAFALAQAGEFAFVIFSFAAQLGIASDQVLGLGISVVALSMTVTPLLFIVNERMIQPRLCDGIPEEEQEPDEVEERNKVIIAGFGHFGSTVGRFLRANGVEATFIDNDPDRVNLLRKLGFKVYFGDATRADFLLAAGAQDAEIFISAIDDPERNYGIVESLQKFFPHIQIMMRANNRYDAYEFVDMGVKNIYRESLDTSIRLGVDVLRKLGGTAYTSTRAGQQFLKRDEEAMWELAGHRHDEKAYISEARARIELQEELLEKDMEDKAREQDHAWDSEPLVRGFGAGE
ncbi:MAG: potassium transporter [Acidobacteria bacterium]|nr:MAG: potassium transporter [Acidobacteriota bacterium]REK04165.1 MAG: potassium transporter [Acidobacteriota bacterium]REK15327.1 MAG: potassium transporter [Acidobacteriota bacterium]REK46417.1 MAG: potassium transporter [Acidobacteriota bacterium]